MSTFLTGLISGFIASLCFATFTLLIRPRIIVAPNISINKGKTYIKIVNKTHSNLINIEYALYYVEPYSKDYITDIEKINPLKLPFTTLEKYSRKDKNKNYAVRISFDELDLDKLKEGYKLRFVFKATHSKSNTTTCKMKYYSYDQVVHGVYSVGKSTLIINKNHL